MRVPAIMSMRNQKALMGTIVDENENKETENSKSNTMWFVFMAIAFFSGCCIGRVISDALIPLLFGQK